MPSASSRRAAAAAPSARQRTRPPSRTGSVESRTSRKSDDWHTSTWEADSFASGSTTAWESENDQPIAGLFYDIFHALRRLERRGNGKKRALGSSTPVWQPSFVCCFRFVSLATAPLVPYAYPNHVSLYQTLWYGNAQI